MSFSGVGIHTARYIDSMVFDAVIEESHSSDLDISSHPIEDGSIISDHAVLSQRTVSIIGMVSNHNIKKALSGGLVIGDVFGSGISSIQSGSSGIVHGSDLSKVSATYAAFLNLQNIRAVFDVQTGLNLYESCMLESIQVKQSFDWENAVLFKANCKQVNIVSSAKKKNSRAIYYKKSKGALSPKSTMRTPSNKGQSAIADRAESVDDRGRIPETNDNDNTTKRKQSALFKMLN